MAILNALVSPPLARGGQQQPAAVAAGVLRRSPIEVGSGALSLGDLVAIVVGGTVAAGVCIAFLCIWLSRRRALRGGGGVEEPFDVHEACDTRVGADDDASFTASNSGTARSPRKLRKQERRRGWAGAGAGFGTDMTETETGTDSLAPSSRGSSVQPPPLFARKRSSSRSALNPFGSVSRRGSRDEGARRMSGSTWINEDALHGPKVVRRQRRSIRESWPLRAMVPTLPWLHGGQEQQRQLDQPEPRDRYSQEEMMLMEAIPPRQLPQPPCPAVLPGPRPGAGMPAYDSSTHRRQAAGDGAPNTSPTRRDGASNNSISPVRTPTHRHNNVYRSASRGRVSSTDSTLSEILRSTEKRLQDGYATGVARRNRASASSSPTKRTYHGGGGSRDTLVAQQSNTSSPLAAAAGGSNSTLCVAGTPLTPSPVKRGGGGSGSGHGRQPSESSVVSEGDSLYGEDTGADADEQAAVMGLSSPSRSNGGSSGGRARELERARAALQSPSSSESSALSTVYSEDERQEGATHNNTNAGPNVAAQGLADGDPFVSTSPARGRQQGLSIPSRYRRTGVARGSSASPSRSDKSNPQTPISGNGGSPTRSQQRPAAAARGGGGGPADAGTPTRPDSFRLSAILSPPEGTSTDDVGPKKAANPALFVTSPSTASEASTPRGPIPGLMHPSHAGQQHQQLGIATAAGRRRSSTTESRRISFLRDLHEMALFPAPQQPGPVQLRQGPPSPTLSMRSTGGLSSVYDCYTDATPTELSPPPSPQQQGGSSPRMRSSIRIVSAASSEYSQDDVGLGHHINDHDHGAAAVIASPVGSPEKRHSSPIMLSVREPPAVAIPSSPTRKSAAVAVAPLRQPRRNSSGGSGGSSADDNAGTLQVASTIAELRRMNSQISAYSAASSSAYSQASSAAAAAAMSPPVPALRGGFFEQRQPSPLGGGSGGRAKEKKGGAGRNGSKHYLALGSSNGNMARKRAVSGAVKARDTSIGEEGGRHRAVGLGVEKENNGGVDLAGCSFGEVDPKSARLVEIKAEEGDLRDGAGSDESNGRKEDRSPGRRGGGKRESTAAASSATQATPPSKGLLSKLLEREQRGTPRGRRSEDSLGLYDKDGFLIGSPERGVASPERAVGSAGTSPSAKAGKGLRM